ncbi:hypothetical protein [Desulfosporosinus sp. FKA]|uniref:hypothetical protein n=1 Tax=Desulfosporosinus sp. FKA TaxID=1969834 RepID=UPI000B49B869|nr:hypothetical protein [Desulfosporosinus sp. FKA]
MIPNDPVLTVDPWDDLCTTLSTQFKNLVPSLKYAVEGWPDPKWFEDTGVNFPSAFFVKVGEKGTNTTGRAKVFKTITNSDGTGAIYFETKKILYLLQISLFTTDPQQRLDIGWAIMQYLNNQIQLPINTVNTARFVFKSLDRMPEGRDNFYQRDMQFEAQTRILDGVQGYKVTNLIPSLDISPTTQTS